MVGILQGGIERTMGGVHLLHQVAKGPTDSGVTALAYSGSQLDKVGHQLWDGHQTLHNTVGIAGVPQVVQSHNTLQGDRFRMRQSVGLSATLSWRIEMPCCSQCDEQTSADLQQPHVEHLEGDLDRHLLCTATSVLSVSLTGTWGAQSVDLLHELY